MTDRDLRQLGALLHDIGKFAFRARPLEQGGTHEHYGGEFIRSTLVKIAAFREHVTQIADEAKRTSPAVRLADYTAAEERQTDTSQEARRLLIAIASRVQLQRDGSTPKAPLPSGTWYIEPAPLTREAPLPKHHPQPPEEWVPDHSEMMRLHQQSWEQFIEELQQFTAITDSWAAIETLYTLLEKYTSTVTSAAYYSLPDITLFDHARVTAALAHCIAEGTEGTECLLVAGDLSGIQRFLYREVGHMERRAKLLRGRSLLVRLVTDTVVSYLLHRLGFYRSNVLYSGGGSFELLLPNTVEIHNTLASATGAMAAMFGNTLGFELQISIASVECSTNRIINDYAAIRHELGQALLRAKRQRFLASLDTIFTSRADHADAIEQLDSICETLGAAAPSKQVLLELRGVQDTSILTRLGTAVVFPEVQIGWALVEQAQLDSLLSSPRLAERIVVHVLNCTNIGSLRSAIARATVPAAASFRFIGSYVPRRENGTIYPFNELAEQGSPNYPLLGFARMDVDWLGMVMHNGLRERNPEERRYTISRVASLSRALDHFFSGSINGIAEQHHIYLVYAGGDDLFAVGAWTNVLEFVRTVREQFHRFVCTNDNITLSCGVAFAKPNYPIDRAAAEAGRLLEVAKQGWAPTDRPLPLPVMLNKNRIALLDCAVEWPTLEQLLTFGHRLLEIVTSSDGVTAQRLPRSLIHRLLSLTQSIFDRRSGGLRIRRSAAIAAAIAQMRYGFARRGLTSTQQAEWIHSVKGDLVKMLLEVSDSDRANNWWNFRIPATYVLWKTRSTT